MNYLSLSGGGTRGVLAHAGAVQYLLDSGRPVHGLAGTSAGALVSYVTAMGYSPAEVAVDLLGRRTLSKRRWGIHRGYPFLYPSTEILNALRALQRPFRRELIAFTSNLATQREHVWDSSRHALGERWPWVILASMSIPLVFQPIRIHGQDHVDGGLTSNFALDAWADRTGENEVLGLFVESQKGRVPANPKGLKAYVSSIVTLAINANIREDVEDAEGPSNILRLTPEGSSLRFDYTTREAQSLVDAGYREAAKHEDHKRETRRDRSL